MKPSIVLPSESVPEVNLTSHKRNLTGVNSTNLLLVKEDLALFADNTHFKMTPGNGKVVAGRDDPKSKFAMRPTTAANHQLYHSSKATNFLKRNNAAK